MNVQDYVSTIIHIVFLDTEYQLGNVGDNLLGKNVSPKWEDWMIQWRGGQFSTNKSN